MPRGQPRKVIAVRLSEGESAEVERAAERAGVGTSTFIRLAGLALARMARTRSSEALRLAQNPDGSPRQRSA